MKLPLDTPRWLEKALDGLEDHVENKLLNAKTSEDSVRASGAFGLWKKIKDDIELETARQNDEIRRRNMSLTEHYDRNQLAG